MISPSRSGWLVGMDKTERVQQLCSEHSKELKGLLDVCSHGRWDKNRRWPIDARKTPIAYISAVGIGNIPRVSTTADHPLMQQLFELYESQARCRFGAHALGC